MPFAPPFLVFAFDDSNSSVGTTSNELEIVVPSTNLGALQPLPPLDTEDMYDAASTAPLMDGWALNGGCIIVRSGNHFFDCMQEQQKECSTLLYFYKCMRQSWQVSKITYHSRHKGSTPETGKKLN
jgi:hypothetical protein